MINDARPPSTHSCGTVWHARRARRTRGNNSSPLSLHIDHRPPKGAGCAHGYATPPAGLGRATPRASRKRPLLHPRRRPRARDASDRTDSTAQHPNSPRSNSSSLSVQNPKAGSSRLDPHRSRGGCPWCDVRWQSQLLCSAAIVIAAPSTPRITPCAPTTRQLGWAAVRLNAWPLHALWREGAALLGWRPRRLPALRSTCAAPRRCFSPFERQTRASHGRRAYV